MRWEVEEVRRSLEMVKWSALFWGIVKIVCDLEELKEQNLTEPQN